MASINGGGTKVGMQPKALLKLPKEMPSNIVRDQCLICIQQIIKPDQKNNGGGAPASNSGMVLINDRRDQLLSQGGGAQRLNKNANGATDFSKFEISKLPLLKGTK